MAQDSLNKIYSESKQEDKSFFKSKTLTSSGAKSCIESPSGLQQDHSLAGITKKLLILEENYSTPKSIVDVLEELTGPIKFVSGLWKDALDMSCISDQAERTASANEILKKLREEIPGNSPLDALEVSILDINAKIAEIVVKPEYAFDLQLNYSSLYATSIRQTLFRIKKMKRMLKSNPL
mmetsp:Transcript_15248/g.18861  ORF Transcript_15248/g.18861 Transcript_15248/m.18861 type:complete len:180 (+) Transcript_15248:198-737(+)|eukprot:CAMPEP_0204825780 /NCGR_PEP_ID=MMETSP1346-20131115/3588_1 /ASSEMBLY_ACC=CAM_ASM_000771 /TAXON_ID=215587 /ORGANISM="Aplanochytrium stocchinoi, Strain GSBS06" /LENGTH=179 /DNA_ID=CAMNT_0051953521 /DNA_START=180 /DNA_END=719 /DNA_ORIENTATION=-